jgi:hypothetical protein
MGNHVGNAEKRVVYKRCSDNRGRMIYNDQFSGTENK